MTEQEKTYLTIIKNNKQLFVYSKDNDTYLSDYFSMSIGTKGTIRREIDKTCNKENEKEKLYRELDEYKDDDYITLNKPKNGSWVVLPLSATFIAKDINRVIEQQRFIKENDKYRLGSIEGQYDQYLSPAEQVELFEKVSRNIGHSKSSKGKEKIFDLEK